MAAESIPAPRFTDYSRRFNFVPGAGEEFFDCHRLGLSRNRPVYKSSNGEGTGLVCHNFGLPIGIIEYHSCNSTSFYFTPPVSDAEIEHVLRRVLYDDLMNAAAPPTGGKSQRCFALQL